MLPSGDAPLTLPPHGPLTAQKPFLLSALATIWQTEPMTEYFKPIPYALWREDKAAFAEALGNSFRETGFAVIAGHQTVDAS